MSRSETPLTINRTRLFSEPGPSLDVAADLSLEPVGRLRAFSDPEVCREPNSEQPDEGPNFVDSDIFTSCNALLNGEDCLFRTDRLLSESAGGRAATDAAAAAAAAGTGEGEVYMSPLLADATSNRDLTRRSDTSELSPQQRQQSYLAATCPYRRRPLSIAPMPRYSPDFVNGIPLPDRSMVDKDNRPARIRGQGKMSSWKQQTNYMRQLQKDIENYTCRNTDLEASMRKLRKEIPLLQRMLELMSHGPSCCERNGSTILLPQNGGGDYERNVVYGNATSPQTHPYQQGYHNGMHINTTSAASTSAETFARSPTMGSVSAGFRHQPTSTIPSSMASQVPGERPACRYERSPSTNSDYSLDSQGSPGMHAGLTYHTDTAGQPEYIELIPRRTSSSGSEYHSSLPMNEDCVASSVHFSLDENSDPNHVFHSGGMQSLPGADDSSGLFGADSSAGLQPVSPDDVLNCLNSDVRHEMAVLSEPPNQQDWDSDNTALPTFLSEFQEGNSGHV